MLKKILNVVLLLTLSACGGDGESKGGNEKKDLQIKGSDTVLPLAQKFAEKFAGRDSTLNVTIVGGGSGVGLAGLQDGTTHIAMSSRDIKDEERERLESNNRVLQEVVIGYDALAVVVHPDNPVSKLTREQLEGMYTGKIKSWKEVGGSDEPIVAYSRESSSGTYEFFKEKVLEDAEFAPGTRMMPATGAIIQAISQTKGGIGYVGLAYVNKEVKTIEVSFDSGKTFASPTMEAAISRTYPVVRPLYFYYLEKDAALVKPFVDYVTSQEGKNDVREVGYVPAQ